MILVTGSRLGPYEILAPLGAGGMGEVYRARDARLGRDVAIKILPEAFASEPGRLKRFEREARSASALNHLNIVTIYDIGSSDAISYIAMELVAGEPLRQVLSKGALSVRRLLQIGVQVADGLAKAHASGIVHRDLKPENVMVTEDGLAKILDFGLAKLTEPEGIKNEGRQGPAVLTETEPGLLLGTVGYMSPEQALGRPVDFRSDQFALGAILYEMATGRRAFHRRSGPETFAAVIGEEPESISALNAKIPAPLRWIVERCLAKEPGNRFASTEDLAGDLATVRDHLAETTSGVELATAGSRRRWAAMLLLGVAAVAIAAVSLLRSRPPAAQIHATRFSLRPPPDGFGSFAFSPDGSQLTFCSAGKLWLRPLSAPEARAIPKVDGAYAPFWSPDGRSIGYFADNKLWRVDLSGAAAVPICDLPEPAGHSGTWGAGGQVLFGTFRGMAIYRVSTSGGKPVAIVNADRARGEMRVRWPWFLPDGKSFLYYSAREGTSGSLMLSPPEGHARPLFSMLSRVEYVDPGYLVFVQEGALLAQRFDARSGTVSGEPFSIADSVRYYLSFGEADFAVSRTGAVAFQTPGTPPRRRMVWLDRAGRLVETLPPTGDIEGGKLDPGGRRVLFERRDPKIGTRDLWILDLERGVETRVTSNKAEDAGGFWLPDGKSIVYSAETGWLLQICRRDLDTGREVALLPAEARQWVCAVAPGGKQLAYEHASDRGDTDVRLVSLSGDQMSSPLLESKFDERGVSFSPDGRCIVFSSDESGEHEAYVAPVAAVNDKTRIFSGRADCFWTRNGSEILCLSGQHVMSVPVRTAPSLWLGQPTPLFTFKEGTSLYGLDVSPDGKRFLAVISDSARAEPPRPLHVVLNWTTEVLAQGGPARWLPRAEDK